MSVVRQPVAWMAERFDADGFDQEAPAVTWMSPDEQRFHHQRMGCAGHMRYCLIPLYRHLEDLPAPAALVLPERMKYTDHCDTSSYKDGWNACIDKAKNLSAKLSVTEPVTDDRDKTLAAMLKDSICDDGQAIWEGPAKKLYDAGWRKQVKP